MVASPCNVRPNRRKQLRNARMTAPRILFLPLSNVLGHLARTFALAEKLHEYKAEVHIAVCDHYQDLVGALPEDIIIHPSLEMPSESSRSFGTIVSFEEGAEGDLINLNSANDLDAEEMQIRAHFLRKMVEQDEVLIEKVQPDIIITDYRFTILNMQLDEHIRVFHISNFLGFPSFYDRVRKQLFSPLNEGTVLVPSIASLEEQNKQFSSQNGNVHWCGPFRWKGWNRLHSVDSEQPKADVFLSFGSTGNAKQLIPWMIRSIDADYSLLISQDDKHMYESRKNVHVERFGSLEHCLKRSRIVCCHGGHGTVLESILQETPMIIFPNNLEQLEIGRRIQQLGLGVLMNQPQTEITEVQLNQTIKELLKNDQIKENLAHFAQLLHSMNGVEKAAEIILSK